MSNPVIQPSFAAGELSPALWARIDFSKYHVGLALAENFFVNFQGGVSNRPGTMIVGQCKGTDSHHLIPFSFSSTQNYILEFGNFYIRFIFEGGYLLETATAITNITQANPGVLTWTGNTPAESDWFYLANIPGMVQLNGQYVVATNVNSAAQTYQLYNPSGDPINTTGFASYSVAGAGSASKVYTVSSPYTAGDVGELKYAQSADVLTLTHVDYVPYDLTRNGHTSWTLSPITFGSTGPAVVNGSVQTNSAGSTTYVYAVTGVNSNGEEGVASGAPIGVAAATMSVNPNVYNTVNWTGNSEAIYYKIYRSAEISNANPGNQIFLGLVGTSPTNASAFLDQHIEPDFTDTYNRTDIQNFGAQPPKCTAYYQQRQVYAGATATSQTFFMSRPGARKNFSTSTPSQDSDAIQATLSSQQVNSIEFMVPVSSGIIMFTSGSAFLVNGGSSVSSTPVPITPTNVSATPQLFNGINGNVQPLNINSEIIYIQSMGSTIRNFVYNIASNNFVSSDLTVLSEHLFTGYEIVDWDWAQEPFKLIWVVRNDGTLLSCTYLREQEVNAWSRHATTNGFFRSIAQIQEGNESAVYFIVERYVNGHWVQYVERLASRDFGNDISAAWFLDSAVQTGGTNPSAQITPNTTSGTITISATGGVFSSADVGKWIKVNEGVVSVTTFTSTSQVVGSGLLVLASTYPAGAGEWTSYSTASVFVGLSHLEGQTVYANADGAIQGPFVVANASCTISSAAHFVTIGLPYTATMQTLYLDTGDPTIQSKRKKISAVSARVVKTRGIDIGQDLTRMYGWKGANGRSESPVVQGQLPEMTTGDMRINLDPNINIYGQVYIRQTQPWPATITGVIPEPVVGDDTK